ncbi:hypothetical protein PCANC_18308 [Puccinia coronata f. sp. avenae]|uniref:Uncharacterized protein n=1 Tax=Puccinia coronata f. sp. avenae TaxID=200324 RepID=A0A2N5UCF4_9BASI|nr:hypothetical protein PCANC_18308 [Puccinia coronata f. sp. avenae]
MGTEIGIGLQSSGFGWSLPSSHTQFPRRLTSVWNSGSNRNRLESLLVLGSIPTKIVITSPNHGTSGEVRSRPSFTTDPSMLRMPRAKQTLSNSDAVLPSDSFRVFNPLLPSVSSPVCDKPAPQVTAGAPLRSTKNRSHPKHNKDKRSPTPIPDPREHQSHPELKSIHS